MWRLSADVAPQEMRNHPNRSDDWGRSVLLMVPRVPFEGKGDYRVAAELSWNPHRVSARPWVLSSDDESDGHLGILPGSEEPNGGRGLCGRVRHQDQVDPDGFEQPEELTTGWLSGASSTTYMS